MDLNLRDTSSELTFDGAIKKLSQAWKTKEKELLSDKSQKLTSLTQELNKSRIEFNESKKKLQSLEEKNAELQSALKELYIENTRLEDFRSKLLETLEEDSEPRRKIFSPKVRNVEEQGREFFSYAKARLSYESFTLFSSYVKQLNEKSISKEQALEEVREVFGPENEELYEMFEILMNRY